ncbi:MAG TPA: HD-GYP domain-containing protein [Gaiellaceae bacterium]|nr:HD-GYP domain-containing protein [Gaiellaceae bacterium]
MSTAAVETSRHPWRLRGNQIGGLKPAAWAYWAAIVLPAALGILLAANRVGVVDWNRFVALAALASASQLLSFHLNRRRVFHPAIVFIVAGALLLPPQLMILLVVITCVPDWLKQRYPWYIQTFNIANYVMSGVAAWAVGTAIGFPASPGREAAAGACAAVTFVLANRLVLLPMLYLGRGLTPRKTGLLDAEDVTIELVLALMAVPLAGLWAHSVLLAALALAPLFLIHFTQRAVFRLEEASETIVEQNASLEEAHRAVIERSTAALEALSATVDARDTYTAGHSRRVAASSAIIARELGLTGAALDIVEQAALLHDIGKIGVPDAVLLKEGPLTAAEWVLMRSHAEEGARIIERLGYLDAVVPSIRHHHERMDGRGYPDGLLGDEIPLGARIIHVADSLDAMTTKRLYREEMSFEAALEEIRRGRGTDFCELCVDAFESAVAKRLIGRLTLVQQDQENVA